MAVWLTRAGDTSIAIMDADGSVERTIPAPDGATFPQAVTTCNGLARWSPDGRTLAATALTSTSGEAVAIVDVATGDSHILDVGMRVCGFAWSPVGSILAFTGGEPGQGGLYVSDPEAREPRRLSPEGREIRAWGLATTPFGPDGASITAEQMEAPGTPGTVVAFGLDGSQRSLVPGSAASVSPDGRWVSLLRGDIDSRSPHEQYVAPVDGSAEPRLVSDEVCGCTAEWSPDGTRLATWTPSWDEVLILDPFGDAPPVRSRAY